MKGAIPIDKPITSHSGYTLIFSINALLQSGRAVNEIKGEILLEQVKLSSLTGGWLEGWRGLIRLNRMHILCSIFYVFGGDDLNSSFIILCMGELYSVRTFDLSSGFAALLSEKQMTIVHTHRWLVRGRCHQILSECCRNHTPIGFSHYIFVACIKASKS